jgi:SAM-dependent methyltransferase
VFYEKIDFAKMYREHKLNTDFKGKKSSDWDARSKEMAPSMQNSPYVDDFISRMDITGDEVVLDIGCGPGTLAIPLAKRVKEVIAIDFSAQMLYQLEKYAKEEGVHNIKTVHLGWDDDWSDLPMADIAVASRSMEVQDLQQALDKMSSKASKACYLTYKVGGSYVDLDILEYIGKKITLKPDFWYVPLLLYKRGYLPSVDYIYTKRGNIKSSTQEEFVESLIWSLGGLDTTQQNLAREYYQQFIDKKNNHPKPFTWAFIKWSTT